MLPLFGSMVRSNAAAVWLMLRAIVFTGIGSFSRLCKFVHFLKVCAPCLQTARDIR